MYDEDNRLVQAVNAAGTSTFAYDYRSRRYYRSTPNEETWHVFDGGLSIQEYDATSNPTPQTSNLLTEFIRGEGMGGGVGGMVYSLKHPEPSAQNQEPSIICSHANHRGDIIARSDSTGSLTSFALYEAYGTRPYEWGDDSDRQKANTKEEESDLGLLNEGMRFRDLETGVFLTRDPIGYGDGPNVYCYVHCNPITRFDPLGLSWWNPLNSDFFAYKAIDFTVDAGVTVAGGAKDVALSVISTPAVIAERAIFDYKTIPSYVGKHLSRPVQNGFSGRWGALRSTGLAGSIGLGLQEIPAVGNFIPGPTGNMNGTIMGTFTGGINGGAPGAPNDAIKRDGDSANYMTAETGVSTSSTPYDRGTVTEVALGLFGGYKAPALEWTSQVLSAGASSGNSIYSGAHSGGVIRSSVGSNYLGAYGVGVARQYSNQGPGFGSFSNIGALQQTSSLGLRDPTSCLSGFLSPFYSALNSDDSSARWSNAPHQQVGPASSVSGNLSEWNADATSFSTP